MPACCDCPEPSPAASEPYRCTAGSTRCCSASGTQRGKGEPYSDTRGQGGNPLAKAHTTACASAGVTGFRVHDWRHDFATRFLAEGGDVRSLMQVMGWSSPRMVAWYVTYRVDHLPAVLERIA